MGGIAVGKECNEEIEEERRKRGMDIMLMFNSLYSYSLKVCIMSEEENTVRKRMEENWKLVIQLEEEMKTG